jgi:arylsulfate sulfotransferase
MNVQAHKISKGLVIVLLCLANSFAGYSNNKILGVKISFPGVNVLNVQVEVNTADVLNASIKCWMAGQKEMVFISEISGQKKNHRFLIPNLKPGQQYVFKIITSDGNSTESSGDYYFQTINYNYPCGLIDTLQLVCANPSALPPGFKKGYIMVYQREDPGIILLLDSKGNILWYYQLKDAGFKVVHFTKSRSFLCLLGTKEYETGYGNAILELSLTGDTLLYLKKGTADFKQTIHHEIILNAKNELITLCVEERVFDLRSKGGSEKDTVRGDGILVLDRQGRKKWKWTVFDELDPLKDENILKNKKDWMHANSVSLDKDRNYLISFYNNGQIWKIDAKTGRVIWKFGRGGDFEMPAWTVFDEAHAVHINERGWLMFFDNGAKHHQSRSLAFKLNENGRKARVMINALLPPQLFTDRMGSCYLVCDTTLLQCISKYKTVVLTNLRGNFLWELRSNRIISYRAEFISKEKLEPFFAGLVGHTSGYNRL